MVEFVVRARGAPVDPDRFNDALGSGAGVEYLATIISNALFVSKDHRRDTSVTLVLEQSADFSRTVTFSGDSLGSLQSLHEKAMLGAVVDALKSGRGLGKDESCYDDRGVLVSATSFEHLVKARTQAGAVYLLDRDGQDIRSAELKPAPVFVMTDHTPMPKKTFRSMARQGVINISVGPRTLHASQCITLIHDELDRRNRKKG